MHRFKISRNEIEDARAPLSQEETVHALRVLRLKDGDEIQVLDGEGGLWSACLRVKSAEEAYCELTEELSSRESDVFVTVYMGIPKGDKLEFLAQKLTELGVKRLVPVRMERSIAKIEEKEKDKKLARLRKIAQEAQKQCGRGLEMEITDPMNFDQAVKDMRENDVTLLLWEEAKETRIRDIYREMPGLKKVASVVGPEGGISQKEADKIISAGAKCITLGPRILRAETAAVTGAGIIMSLWGDI
ncbi:MAG: 16S rRNA (uracil(1498)-N(3))-methyltransferase [Clostridia bacterium]|nr:16S rRNA (uracil(1498)-N(3))-methyltransferase [Clostridia bacterium]